MMMATSNPFEQQLEAMRKAFGAPGDHGYGTKEGDTLFGLYRFLGEMADERDRAEKAEATSYQERVQSWVFECFGPELTYDQTERVHRFFEEAAELAQSTGCTQGEALALVEYVFERPAGQPYQETGGVLTTLAALCSSAGLNMQQAGEDELARITTPEVMARVRAKNAAKPRSSPLPGNISALSTAEGAA